MAPLSLYGILVMLHGLLGTLQLVGLVRKYGLGKFAKAAKQITLPFAYFAIAECISLMKTFTASLRYSFFMPASILIHVILITAAVYTVVSHNSEHAFVINSHELNANSSRRRRNKLNANCNSPRTSNPAFSETSDDSMFSKSSENSPNSRTSAHPNNHPLYPATNAGTAAIAIPQRTQTVFFVKTRRLLNFLFDLTLGLASFFAESCSPFHHPGTRCPRPLQEFHPSFE